MIKGIILICSKPYSSSRPSAVVVQLGREQTNPHFLSRVEIDKALGAVDVVEGSEALDRAINGHGMHPKLAPGPEDGPVRVGAAYEHAGKGSRASDVVERDETG